jgi:hypothetical protein
MSELKFLFTALGFMHLNSCRKTRAFLSSSFKALFGDAAQWGVKSRLRLHFNILGRDSPMLKNFIKLRILVL